MPARLPPASSSSEQNQFYVVRLKDHGFGGPLALDALKSALDAGTLAWTDIAYVNGGAVGSWKRIFEIEALKKYLPQMPESERMKKYTDRATSAPLRLVPASGISGGWAERLAPYSAKIPRAEWSSPRYWYLLLDGKEIGPVELSHIDLVSKSSRAPDSVYGWHVSLKRWKPLSEIPELSKYVGKASARTAPELSLVIERGTQKRRSARKSLVAAVFQLRGGGKSDLIGVCGDVSPDGFQLHQHGRTVDYITGTQLDIEIRASKTSKITGLRARAVVKWFDPVKKIVGLEFILLDPMDRKLLEKFTNSLV